jgi:hypothetical protein
MAIIQKDRDIAERKTHRVGRTDELQPLQGSFPIETIVALTPPSRSEQPDALVIPQRRARNPRHTGQLANGKSLMHN